LNPQAAAGRLRLLHVILTRGFAGSERAAAETCNGLARRHDVALAVRRDHRSSSGASILDYLDSSVTVFELPPVWRTRATLRTVIDTWEPQLIHTHLRRGTRYVVQLATDVPHFATVHIGLNGPHYLATDALCCISPWQVQATVDAGYLGDVFLVPNTLLPQACLSSERRARLRGEVNAGPDDFVVGGVGRLTDGKGFDVLIDAFRAAALPASKLVIVGDGHERTSLERRAADLPVAFTGFRNDAKDWFQVFDLFVSPSRSEPFGRVIIEALDAGTPVIATDALGPRDIAARYPVELVEAGDATALASAMLRAYDRPRARSAVNLAEFDLERVTETLVAAYRSVLRSPLAEEAAAAARVAA
jgi:glycosyltransferase involved in cell wall biosynthesis